MVQLVRLRVFASRSSARVMRPQWGGELTGKLEASKIWTTRGPGGIKNKIRSWRQSTYTGVPLRYVKKLRSRVQLINDDDIIVLVSNRVVSSMDFPGAAFFSFFYFAFSFCSGFCFRFFFPLS